MVCGERVAVVGLVASASESGTVCVCGGGSLSSCAESVTLCVGVSVYGSVYGCVCVWVCVWVCLCMGVSVSVCV